MREEQRKVHVESGAAAAAAQRQERLLRLLACPRCRGRLGVSGAEEVPSRAVAAAGLVCRRCGEVGWIDAYRPTFLTEDPNHVRPPEGFTTQRSRLDLRCLVHGGNWQATDDGSLVAEQPGATLAGVAVGAGGIFEFLRTPWSGSVRIQYGDRLVEVDLRRSTPSLHRIAVCPELPGEHTWTLTLLEPPEPMAATAVVKSIHHLVAVSEAEPLRIVPENRGNPYPARFGEILAGLASDATVLDLGGGDRRHADDRVLNLEYLPYELVDLYADGLQLPFPDDVFDAVLSQAVLEHVPDPHRAVDEIRRVLKPGGTVYAEFAFMQPLHAVPYHFFNITPHGAELLFRDFEDMTFGVFGGLGETMRWFFRLVDAERRVGAPDAETVLGVLDRLDGAISAEELGQFASAVWVEASAPPR
jgi:uncharacterized protein YbaR (Trm112 family)